MNVSKFLTFCMQRIKEHIWTVSFSRAFQFLLSLMVCVADLYHGKQKNKYLIIAHLYLLRF